VEGFEDEQKAYQYETDLITAIGSNYIPEIKDGPLTNMNLISHIINRQNVKKGEKHCHAKLTEKDVRNILHRLAQV